MYLANKYTVWYYNIVNKAQTRALDKNTYSEKHHIIPRSLGGSNNKENIVRLTAREHFVCHLLLTKMLTGNSKALMEFAHQRMCYGRPNSKRYTPAAYRKRIGRSKEQRHLVSQQLKGTTTAKDMYGNIIRVSIDDTRWKTGELMGVSKGITFRREKQKNKALAKDPITGNIIGLVSKNDPRWKTKEIVFHLCGVKGNRGKAVQTPKGIFRSSVDAAISHQISASVLRDRIKSSDTKWKDYYYL